MLAGVERLEGRDLLTSVPIAFNDPFYATPVSTDLIITAVGSRLLANDYDAEGATLTASVVANPSHGTLISFNSNGSFTYRPTTGYSGFDSFTYQISDGSNTSNVATV